MKRWIIVGLALILLGGAFWFTWLRPTPPKRFILIVCDSMRADHLGCYGGPQNLSPNIDAFAQKALLFKNANSVAPWTFASNASLLTGLYPHEACDFDAAVLVDQVPTLAEYFKQAGFKTAAFSSHPIISKQWNFDQGFDTFVNDYGTKERKIDVQVLNRSLLWLADNWQDKFFLLVYFYAPHEPYQPDNIPEELRNTLNTLRPAIGRGEVPLSARLRKPVIVDEISDKDDDLHCTLQEIDALHELYSGYINDADRRVGELLKAIGNDPETVVAVMSDHGEEWLDHGGLRHKETLYQELLHVPFILRVPGKSASTITSPVSNLDLFPTFLKLAKIRPQIPLKGEFLLDPPKESPRMFFGGAYHSLGFDKSRGVKPFWVERYITKLQNRVLIHTLSGWPDDPPIPAGGLWEHYDLEADPKEQNMLPNDATASKLRLQLLQFEKEARVKIKQSDASEADIKKRLEDLKNLGYIGK